MTRARPTAGSTSQISVVIPTLGSHETLKRVLEAFELQTVPLEAFELILVADAAEEDLGAVDRAIENRPYATQRLQGRRPGASANRNLGLTAASAPLVLFTDNDTIPTPTLLAEHLASHERYPRAEVGILGLIRWAPELEVTTFMRWLDTGIQFDFANMDEGDVGWGRFYTANVSLKRVFAESVGGFDEERLPYPYEDTDWAYRASKIGFELHFNPRAVVDHLRVLTLETWKQRARRAAFAEYEFTRLHPELPPWFHGVFTRALEGPPARGRGIRLARYVPPQFPWLGSKVWDSVDSKYKQEIAPYFLAAWDEAASRDNARRR